MGEYIDWLFAVPIGRLSLGDALTVVEELLAVDPATAAFDDLEAEEFIATLYMLRFLNPRDLERMLRYFHVPCYHANEKSRRRGIILLLRRWRNEAVRQELCYFTGQIGVGRFSAVVERDGWTDDLFREAWAQEINILSLTYQKRTMGEPFELNQWLQELGPWAPEFYQIWVKIGRLLLRRYVYKDGTPAITSTTVAASAMVADLQEKDRESGALRQDVRRMEQDRKRLKESVREREQYIKAMRQQARGEVEAARKALCELPTVQVRELAAKAKEWESQLHWLRVQAEAERKEFARSLGTQPAVPVLAGLSVAVRGAEADRKLHRLLVESLGARLVTDGAELEIDGAAGLAAVEQELRKAALRQVLIKCDGLYRRKGWRPGIAVAACEVYASGTTLWSDGATVSCGPLAGSLMAEYGAVALALAFLVKAGAGSGSTVEIRSDCKVLVNRLTRQRRYALKRGHAQLDRTIRRLLAALARRGCSVRIRWVPRDDVHVVDRLCDRVYREQDWYHRARARAPVRPAASLEQFLHGLK